MGHTQEDLDGLFRSGKLVIKLSTESILFHFNEEILSPLQLLSFSDVENASYEIPVPIEIGELTFTM